MSAGTDDIVIGCIYLLTSVLATIFYIPCLKVIRTDPELRNHSCFRLMFHLGLCDIYNLLFQATCGALILTDYWPNVPHWLNRFFSDLLDSFSWHSLLAFIHAIAINRAVTMCGGPKLNALFSDKGTKWWIIACWLYGFVWLCVELCPCGGFIYYPDIYACYFDSSYAWYEYLKQLAKWEAVFHLTLSAVWYLVLACSIRKQRNQVGQVETTERQAVRTKETKIVKQAALICIYPLVWDQWWHLAPVLAADGFRYAFVIGNVCWISNAALNPAVYLLMNKTIGRKVKSMFGLGNNSAPRGQAPARI